MQSLDPEEVRRVVQAALAEDIGVGDATTLSTVPENAKLNVVMRAREALVAAGLPLAEAKKAGAVFAYGSFITVALNFAILALIIFVMIRQINRMKKDVPAPAPEAPPEDVVLLRGIRDASKK